MTVAPGAAVRRHDDHVRLSVRLTPNGGRDAVDGWETGADGESYLKARVSDPPDKGKANKALILLIAKTSGVAKSAVSLLSGDTQRKKILRIEGDPEDIISRLEDAVRG
jgi:uncharacterized protein (TIGR00251 family)